jgi:hypothetical protein
MIELLLSHPAGLAIAAFIYVLLIMWLLGVMPGSNN